MLRCNLAVLMAERNLRITRISRDTGISRTTLTALVSNYSQGIQIDTLNKLCQYLQVGPDQFFAYIPFDYQIDCHMEKEDFFIIYFRFITKGKTYDACAEAEVSAECDVEESESGGSVWREVHGLDVSITMPDPEIQPYAENAQEMKAENAILIKYLSKLPVIFRSDIERLIFDGIYKLLHTARPGKYKASINWPKELI